MPPPHPTTHPTPTPPPVQARGLADGHLFAIKQMLVLREQIAPFEADFSVTEWDLDFSHMRDYLRRTLSGQLPLFTLSSGGWVGVGDVLWVGGDVLWVGGGTCSGWGGVAPAPHSRLRWVGHGARAAAVMSQPACPGLAPHQTSQPSIQTAACLPQALTLPSPHPPPPPLPQRTRCCSCWARAPPGCWRASWTPRRSWSEPSRPPARPSSCTSPS